MRVFLDSAGEHFVVDLLCCYFCKPMETATGVRSLAAVWGVCSEICRVRTNAISGREFRLGLPR